MFLCNYLCQNHQHYYNLDKPLNLLHKLLNNRDLTDQWNLISLNIKISFELRPNYYSAWDRTRSFAAHNAVVKGFVWVWINWVAGLRDWRLHFRVKIILETIPSWFLVFYVGVTECYQNSSGVCPYLWFQEKFVWYRQRTQNAALCPAELVGQFVSDSAFNLLRNLCDIFLVNSRNGRVSWLAVPRMFFLCFSCNGCQRSFVSQRCHLFEGKMLRSYEDWISFYLLINLRL